MLGVGRIGRMHAELLAHRVAGTTLGMVYDAHTPSAEQVGAALDVPVAASADELLANDDLDAVAICTSTDTHVELLVAAAASGKVIFCEKPISLDLAEVDRALASIDEAGARLQIGFNRRFDPAHQFVHDAVAAGTLGAVHLVRISSRDPAPPPIAYIAVSGGIFLDMTCHDIDMARYVTGSEIVEVFASGSVRVDPAIGEAGDLDTAVLTLRHADGCLTVIDNSRRAAYGYDQRVEAFGDAGMASSQNPPAHTATLADRRRDARTAASALLRRALLRQLRAAVGVVLPLRPHRRSVPGVRCRRTGAARRRAGGMALGARGPARRGLIGLRCRQVGDEPAVHRADGVGAQRDLHRPAQRFTGAQVEATVVLRTLDAAVDQQAAGKMGLGVGAHPVEQHVAVVGAAEDEGRAADVERG